jgi:hypothetical protein
MISRVDLRPQKERVGPITQTHLAFDQVGLGSPDFVLEQVGFHPKPDTTGPDPITARLLLIFTSSSQSGDYGGDFSQSGDFISYYRIKPVT